MERRSKVFGMKTLYNLLYVLLLLIILFSCSEKGKESTTIIKEKEITLEDITETYGAISTQSKACLDTLFESDSLLKSYIEYINNREALPLSMSGYGDIGCIYEYPASDYQEIKAIVARLVFELKQDHGNSVKTAIVKDLTNLTGYAPIKPKPGEGFFSLENDSIRTVIIQKWTTWFHANKVKTPYQWAIDALTGGDEYSISKGMNQLRHYADTNSIPHLMALIDTSYFNTNQEPHNVMRKSRNWYVIQILKKMKSPKAIPYIVKYRLSSPMRDYQKDAIEDLVAITGETMGFDLKTSWKNRQRAIKRWWNYCDSLGLKVEQGTASK